jgi:hypothetical protein
MVARLKRYKKLNKRSDLLWIIKDIKGLVYKFDRQRYHAMSLHLERTFLFALYQGRETSNASYLEKFSNCVSVIEQFGGELGVESEGVKAELILNNIDLENASEVQVIAATVVARDKCLVVAYLSGSDKNRYGSLVEDLENDYTKGNNNYPETLNAAYNLVVNYRNHQRPASHVFIDSEGMTFANVEKRVVDRAKVRCFNCDVMGRYANECTEPKKEKSAPENGAACVLIGSDGEDEEYDDMDAFMFINMSTVPEEPGIEAEEISSDYDHVYDAADFEGFTLHQSSKCVNPTWILLESHSTTDILCNVSLLSNIHESGRSIIIHCNSGVRKVTKVGTLKNYGEVWHCKDAIASILSLAKMSKHYPVKFDSADGNKFVVIQPSKEFIFKQSKSGLYFHDTMDRVVVMVNTVKGI